MKKILLLVLLLSPMISFAGEYEKSMNMKDYESIYTEIVISIENTKDLSDTVVDKKLHKKIKRHIHTLKDVIKTPFYNPMTKEMKSSFTPNISLINRTIKTGNTLLNEIKSKYF